MRGRPCLWPWLQNFETRMLTRDLFPVELLTFILLYLLCNFKRVYNITVFVSYLTYSDYIFHGAALVALPCSCR